MRTTENARRDRRRGRKQALLRAHGLLAAQGRKLFGRTRGIPSAFVEGSFFRQRQCVAQETFARSADGERIAELRDLWQLPQQFVILRKAFAETDAGIEHDL